MDNHTDKIEESLLEITFDDAIDRSHKDLLEQKLLLNYNAARLRHDNKQRFMMNNKMVQCAAAAVVVICVLVGLQLFNGSSGLTWAQIRDQVVAADAVTYKVKVNTTENGQPIEVNIEGVLADEHGTRMDVYMGEQLLGSTFTLAENKTHISIMPSQKKYIEVALTERNLIENGDPRLIVEAFMEGDYEELGEREIDGLSVKGIQSNDVSPSAGFPGGSDLIEEAGLSSADVTASLWIDVATGWPVEITMDITGYNGDEKTTIVVSDFEWDAQIDPTTFAAVIPEGYECMYEVNAENLEEGSQLVDGLEYFASINDGKYPTELSIVGVVVEIGDICSSKPADPPFILDDAKVSTLKYGAQYYESLQADEAEPVYNGSTVTSADTDKVLLCWKLEDDQYRVIFGDLKIEDVSAAQLQELEAR